MAWVETRDKQQLYVRELGTGKQPVLMLHGLGMKSSHWLPFLWPLRKQFRFYLPDLRGAGRSSAVAFNRSNVFQNHMEDLEDLVAGLGLDDFLLVGYSLGATTSLHWQNAGGFFHTDGRPRVKAYLHIDQSPCVTNRDGWRYGVFGAQQEWVFARLRRLLVLLEGQPAEQLADLPSGVRRQLLYVLGQVFNQLLGKPAAKPVFMLANRLPWLMPLLLPMTRVADLRAYLTSYTQLGRDYLPGLAGCSTPTTLLIGAKSPLYAEPGQRAIAHQMTDCRVVLLDKSGHVPLLDQPRAFYRELKTFLRQSL